MSYEQVVIILMGNTQCQQCEPQRVALDLTAYSPYHTIGEIEENYRAYAESNMLGFYSVRMQKNIEKLYTLGQINLCNLIIRLTCQQKTEMRDRILDEVELIDLQQLDHLSLIEALPKNVQTKYSAASRPFYEGQNLQQISLIRETALKKSGENVNQKSGLRIQSKIALRGRNQKIQKTLNINNFFIVGTVGCFQSQDVLQPTALPTKKTPLRLFLQKAEGTGMKYHTNILIVFIVSPESQGQFDKQITTYEREVKEDYSDTQEFESPYLKFQKIIYKPIYPCISSDRSIKLTSSGDGILFNFKDGDLIGFMTQNPVMEGLLQKYEFVQMANISNILDPLAEREALGYLAENKEVDIVAPVVIEDSSQYTKVLKLNKYFVEPIAINSTSSSQEHYRLTDSFYLRTLLLTNKGSHFQKLISTRIKAFPLTDSTDTIYFSRTIEQILYSPITLLLITSKKYVTSPQHQEVSYSNYCKSILGISDTKDEEIVEICPQLLYGKKSQLQTIIKKLRSLSSVGFPLVLNSEKIELRKSDRR